MYIFYYSFNTPLTPYIGKIVSEVEMCDAHSILKEKNESNVPLQRKNNKI